MLISGRADTRLIVFAVLAIAFAGWALMAVAPHDTGTMARPGPAMVPELAAIALVAVGAVVLARAASGVATAPPRLLPGPWRLGLLLLLILALLLPDIVVLFARVPIIAALAAWFVELALVAGPADFLALAWLRWMLAIALGVVAAGAGVLSGVASLLVGALIGLSGVDVSTGISRMIQLESLMEEAPYAVEIGVLLVMIACRVNPLPAVLAYVGAAGAEEMFRRAMVLTKGDLPLALTGRPLAATVLAVVALIVLALAWYRWPWRVQRTPPKVIA